MEKDIQPLACAETAGLEQRVLVPVRVRQLQPMLQCHLFLVPVFTLKHMVFSGTRCLEIFSKLSVFPFSFISPCSQSVNYTKNKMPVPLCQTDLPSHHVARCAARDSLMC